MNNYLIIKIVSVLIAALSQVLLKKEASKNHNSIIREYLNFNVILAYFIFGISTILSVISLNGISIGNSMIIESLNYIIIPIAGYFIFKENVNKKSILGIVLIVIGIFIYNI